MLVPIRMGTSMASPYKTLWISRMYQIISVTWILARVSAYLPPFNSQILDFIYWTVLIFILIYFEWHAWQGKPANRNWEITSLHNFLWKLSIQTWVCFFLSSSSFLLQAVIRSANCRLLISKSSCTFSTSTCFLSSRVDWTVLSPVSSSLLADCKTINIKRGVWIHRYMISAAARLLARGGLYNRK